MNYLYIFPFDGVSHSLLMILKETLEKKFGLPSRLTPTLKIPQKAYNVRRKQYFSSVLLEQIEAALPEDAARGLGVADVDLYVPELNFVFGEAQVKGKVAVISTCRLNPEFYGMSANPKILEKRAAKEAVHEIGHTFGLMHCDIPQCVMYFSNSITDTDLKEESFCSSCERRLKENLSVLDKGSW